LHRLGLEDRLDALVAPVVHLARGLDWVDARLRRALSVERDA
jgi:hypothetical protein